MAALGDVARGFGQADNGGTLAAQAGLSGTDLGIGLALTVVAAASPTYRWFVAIKSGPVKGGFLRSATWIRLESPWFWPAETACT